jgi:hypothetical protein
VIDDLGHGLFHGADLLRVRTTFLPAYSFMPARVPV